MITSVLESYLQREAKRGKFIGAVKKSGKFCGVTKNTKISRMVKQAWICKNCL